MTEPAPLTPEVDTGDEDLDQSDTHPTLYPAVAVSVEGIARVRSLPARRAALGRVHVPGDGVPVQIVGRHDQRLSVALVTRGAAISLTDYQPSAESDAGYYAPSGEGWSGDYSGPLWAVNTSGIDAVVSTTQIYAEE